MMRTLLYWQRVKAVLAGPALKRPENRVQPTGRPSQRAPRTGLATLLVLLAGLPFTAAWAQCNTTATTTLSFTDTNPARPAGENWNGHLQTGVPEPLGVTRVSSSVLTGGNATSSLVVGMLNSNKSLVWSSDFSAVNGVVNVTFNFTRPLSSFTVNLADIDASRSGFLDLDPNYTDEVVVTGANGTTNTPLTDISLVVVGGTASNALIAGNTVTGVDDNNANTSATVQARFASAITSLTLSYRNGSVVVDPDGQTIGIDQMTWCRLAPLATNTTTATVPSTAVQTGITNAVQKAPPNGGAFFYCAPAT